jgi:phage terminase large subunit
VSKVLGEFPEVADDTLISPKLIRDARENVLDGLDPGQFGGDVARKGRDETVVYRNRGGVIRLVKRLPNQDTMATAGAFALILREAGNAVPMFVDMIGIGAGVYDRLKEQNLWVVGFDAGGQAYDPTRFVNRRAEAYWELREGFEEGNIDLDELDDDLAAQLQSIKWKTDSRGRKLIESKDDMKKRGLPSPDRADAAMMAFATPPYTPLPDATNRVPGLTDDLLDKKM